MEITVFYSKLAIYIIMGVWLIVAGTHFFFTFKERDCLWKGTLGCLIGGHLSGILGYYLFCSCGFQMYLSAINGEIAPLMILLGFIAGVALLVL